MSVTRSVRYLEAEVRAAEAREEDAPVVGHLRRVLDEYRATRGQLREARLDLEAARAAAEEFLVRWRLQDDLAGLRTLRTLASRRGLSVWAYPSPEGWEVRATPGPAIASGETLGDAVESAIHALLDEGAG